MQQPEATAALQPTQVGPHDLENGREMDRDSLRKNLLKFTDRAFELLPPMESPRVLDLGCGTGLPTVRLAALTGGRVIGLDSNREALEVLKARVDALGLSDRVQTHLGSVEEIPFEAESFDLIWCEGAVSVMGFRKSLRSWRGLLKPQGFVVLHDEAADIQEKLRMADEEGFAGLGHFEVSEQLWWDDYYALANEGLDISTVRLRFLLCPVSYVFAMVSCPFSAGTI
jgi:SAM-dependent methyltransferase